MLNSLSIRNKLITLPVILALAMLCEVALVNYSLQQNKADAQIMNLAGRQRMLTKKFSAEMLFRAEFEGQDLPGLLTADKTIALYEQTLRALLHGGQTYTDLGMTQPITLPKMDYRPFVDQLHIVETLWEQQQQLAEKLGHHNTPELAQQFLEANHKAMGAMNKAVVIYARHANEKLNRLNWESVLLALFVIVAASLLAWVVIRDITTPIRVLVRVSKRIAEGKLTQDPELIALNSRNELGQLAENVEQMRTSLQDTMADVQRTSSSISLSSQQVSDLSGQISEANRNEKQRFEDMNENSSALEHATQRLSEVTSETLTMVTECNQLSSDATERVHQNINMMAQTAEKTNQTRVFVQELNHSAEQVSGIVDSIRSISEQTNLLALNAAIEAARAGEQGRGFAVVADEVRSLAASTGASTDEIAVLINQLTKGVQQVVESMDEVASKVEESRQKSKQTEQGIQNVSERILMVADAQQQIDSQVELQNQQLSQLKDTQQELLEIIDSSHQKSETSSLVAQQLSRVSVSVSELIDRFNVDKSSIQLTKNDVEQRAHPRIQTGLYFVLKQMRSQVQGLTEDLSLGGVKLIVPAGVNLQPKKSANVLMSYMSNGEYKNMQIDGEIIDIRCDTENRQHVHFKFSALSSHHKGHLEAIFAENGVNPNFDGQGRASLLSGSTTNASEDPFSQQQLGFS